MTLCIRKGYHLFVLKFFSSHSAGKFPEGTNHCVRKIRVSETFSAQEGEITSFCWIILLTPSAEKLRGGTLQSLRKIRVWNNFLHMKGISLFSVENFFVSQCEIFRGGTIQCFRKIRISKKFLLFLHKEQKSIFSVETLLSHSVKKIRRENLLCFRKTAGMQVFMQRRGHLVLLSIFCFTGSKSFVRVPFCIPESLWCGQKVMDKRWGLSRFYFQLFCLVVPEIFVEY